MGLSPDAVSGGCSLLHAQVSHCGDFSCCRALGSTVAFSGCETFKECGEEEGAMICHLQSEKKKEYRQDCHGKDLKLNTRNTFWISALVSTRTLV